MLRSLQQVFSSEAIEVIGIDLTQPPTFSLDEHNFTFLGLDISRFNEHYKNRVTDAIVWNYPSPYDIYHSLREESSSPNPVTTLRPILKHLKPSGLLLLQTELPIDKPSAAGVYEMQKIAASAINLALDEAGLFLQIIDSEPLYDPQKYGTAKQYFYTKRTSTV